MSRGVRMITCWLHVSETSVPRYGISRSVIAGIRGLCVEHRTETNKCWQTGTVIQRTTRLHEPVSSCVWVPSGDCFILGSFDKAHALTTWSSKGEELHTWTTKFRVEDLTISPDSQWLIAMDDQALIHVFDYETRELKYDLELECRGTSIRISADSQYLLVNKKDAVAQLINIATTNTVQKYMGHQPGEFTIRSDLGGANELYVISGSEGTSTTPQLFPIAS